MVISNEDLRKIMLDSSLIDAGMIEAVAKEAVEIKKPLSELLIEKDLVSDENLGVLISDYLKIPYIRLSKITIPDEILAIIPEVVAKKQKVIAFARDQQGLQVAMANPTNDEVVSFLSKKIGENIVKHYATDRDIEDAMRLYKKELQKTFDKLIQDNISKNKNATTDMPVAQLVSMLIEYAYQNKASDIHIEPEDEDALVRFRIDGVLHDVLHLPLKMHEQVVSRIKVLSRLRTDEHLGAQDGKMQQEVTGEQLDIRVSIVPVVNGEKTVLRLLSSRSRQFSLSDLGLSQKDLEKIRNGFTKPYGMVLSTGPTGSGKTTSIYSILKILNTREKNIATIEDPVEYDIEGINQIQVNTATNLTFADGLRSILRQDPDIIFVGEIRDKETAGIAVNSAMTGHLVLSTLHTNNAATSLPRLIDMDIEPFLVSSTVNVIFAQRLVRKICDKCKVSKESTLDEISKHFSKEELVKIFGEKSEVRIYNGKGCPICHNTGYNGRIGIFEVLQVTPKIQALINSKADAGTLERAAREEGMTTMLEDSLLKVKAGITTIEEALRATKE